MEVETSSRSIGKIKVICIEDPDLQIIGTCSECHNIHVPQTVNNFGKRKQRNRNPSKMPVGLGSI